MSKSRFNTPQVRDSLLEKFCLVVAALTLGGLYVLSVWIGASL